MRIQARKLALVAALSLTACATASPRATDNDARASLSPVLDRIRERGKIVVGTTGNQPPLVARDKDGGLIGLEADLARLIALSMGVEPEIKAMAFSELLPALGNGTVDLVLSGMTMTSERNMKVAFVGPYFISGTSVLTKEGSIERMADIERINDPNTRLAALKGSTSQHIVEDLIPKATLKLVTDYDDAVQMVIKGDVDAVIADHLFCVLTALRHEDDKLTTLLRPLTFEPIGVALPPNDPLLVNWMDNFFLMLEGTGLLDDLTARWLEDPSWLEDVDPKLLD
jgi:polar amino acid transport system substrate-binding protein